MNILPNLTNSQEPEPEPIFFGPLEPDPEPLEKNTMSRSQSRSRLGKKSGARAGATWKKIQESEPEPEQLKICMLPCF